MLGMLSSLTKAVVGAVVETPVSIAADIVTMGGAMTDKKRPYTTESVSRVIKNLEDAVKPEK